MSDSDICSLWWKRGRVASARGTLLHYQAEAWLNGRCLEEPWSREFQHFLMLEAALREFGWRPFRTEVCLFHCGLCCAGQLDALFRNDAGELCLLDWKCCKNIVFDAFRSLRPPCEHMPDCNGSLYALQLNTYRFTPGTRIIVLMRACPSCPAA